MESFVETLYYTSPLRYIAIALALALLQTALAYYNYHRNQADNRVAAQKNPNKLRYAKLHPLDDPFEILLPYPVSYIFLLLMVWVGYNHSFIQLLLIAFFMGIQLFTKGEQLSPFFINVSNSPINAADAAKYNQKVYYTFQFFIWSNFLFLSINTVALYKMEDDPTDYLGRPFYLYVPIMFFFLTIIVTIKTARTSYYILWRKARRRNPDTVNSLGTLYTGFGLSSSDSNPSTQASHTTSHNPADEPQSEAPRMHWGGSTKFNDTTDRDWLDAGDANDTFGGANGSGKLEDYDREVRYDDEDHW